MHDHVADGMLVTDHQGVTARALRLHLDEDHDSRTRGWGWDFAAMERLHLTLHELAEDERLAGIEAAAGLIAERMAAASPAVVESIVGDRSMYLSDANGTVYLAEQEWTDAWGGPLYRLTVQADETDLPPAPVDLMDQLRESLAAANRSLSTKPPQREASGATPAVDAPAAAPTADGES